MKQMTSLERVLTALEHKEPDRVPFFLSLSMQGAKELKLSIKEYYSKPEYVTEGQLRLREKYRHDNVSAYNYAAVEVEAWGAEVLYRDDGPPNAARPFIKSVEEFAKRSPPVINETPCLLTILKTIELLKKNTANEVPIFGAVISPFSIPIMQMGFEKYIELIYSNPKQFQQLMDINQDFCIKWANAQLAAGATAICYVDPFSSPTIIPPSLFETTGFIIAQKTIKQINGATTIHLASGLCLPIIDNIIKTGTRGIGVSAKENLADVKKTCRKKITVIGNLNGIEMRRWTPKEAEEIVKNAIVSAGPGGGFILSDNHGEIPWQVTDEVLKAISDAVHAYGMYPIKQY